MRSLQLSGWGPCWADRGATRRSSYGGAGDTGTLNTASVGPIDGFPLGEAHFAGLNSLRPWSCRGQGDTWVGTGAKPCSDLQKRWGFRSCLGEVAQLRTGPCSASPRGSQPAASMRATVPSRLATAAGAVLSALAAGGSLWLVRAASPQSPLLEKSLSPLNLDFTAFISPGLEQ